MSLRATCYPLVGAQILCLAALALTGQMDARHPMLLLVEVPDGLLGV